MAIAKVNSKFSSKQKEAEIADNLAQIRHAIKNHMSVIIAFTQLTQATLQKNKTSSEQVEQFLTTIDQRARKVVDEIDHSLRPEFIHQK
jgi:hypothetical protein